MAKRSLQASPEGIIQAKRAFERRGWTQEYLAAEVGLQTRQSVWKFFSGRSVERHIFIDLCFTLDLEWEDIVARPEVLEDHEEMAAIAPDPTTAAATDLLDRVRSRLTPQIQSQCHLLELPLELSCPLTLAQIYTESYLYPRHLAWASSGGASPPPRLLLTTAVQQHPHLLILGGAGSGKTTLMQHLALEAIANPTQEAWIPVFLRLRQLALRSTVPLDLQTLINQTLQAADLSPADSAALWQRQCLWLLLDGWDELPSELQSTLTQQVQMLLDQYPRLRIGITSRPGGLIPALRGVAVMHLAEFSTPQVQTFVRRWFTATDAAAGEALADACLEALQRPENDRLRELSVTPLLLHLICLVFWGVRQFPTQRSKLYQQALDMLLGRWDQQRGICRDPAPENLSTLDLMGLLSYVAIATFERSRVMFEKAELLTLMAQYLNQHGIHAQDPERRWNVSNHILRMLVEHYGILAERAYETFSFSHLSFQEYLVARRLVITAPDRQTPDDWQDLAAHLTDARWRDVIGLTVEMLPDASPLLRSLQQQAHHLLAADPALQSVVDWLHTKGQNAPSSMAATALQAYYLGLLLNHDLDLAIALDPNLALEQSPDLALDEALSHLIHLAQQLMASPTLQDGFNLYFAMDLSHRFSLDDDFVQPLKQLQATLANALETEESLCQWGQQQITIWFEQLRHLCGFYRHLDPIGTLHDSQYVLLRTFYRAQRLIVACTKQATTPFEVSLFEPESCYECR